MGFSDGSERLRLLAPSQMAAFKAVDVLGNI